jgi:hypothetical protein
MAATEMEGVAVYERLIIINLKAAKQIGLMTPPNMLVRADKVIK